MHRGTRTTIVAPPSGRKHITVLIWVRNVKYMGTGANEYHGKWAHGEMGTEKKKNGFSNYGIQIVRNI